MNILRNGSKKLLAMMLVFTLVVGLMPLTAAAQSQQYSDASGHWAEESINKVIEEGLFNGVSENSFDPQGNMTRAMFITVLHRLAEQLEGPAIEVMEQQFTDVPADAWYADSLNWAVSAGLTEGYGQGIFAPNQPLDREQITVLLIRFLEDYLAIELESKEVSLFADDEQISAWAKQAVYKAVSLGLIKGEADNTFNGKGVATRAVVAVVSDRFIDKAKELVQAQPEETPEPSATPEPTPEATVEPTFTPDYGTGSSGSGSTSKVSIKKVTIQRNGEAVADSVIRSGEQLTVAVEPKNAKYTTKWLVNGVVKSEENTYTVQALDLGATIVAEVTGTGNYKATVQSDATSKVLAKVDLASSDENSAPVVIASDVTYKDADGNDVTLTGEESLAFSVTASEEEVPAEEKENVVAKLAETFESEELDVEELNIKYFAIDAELVVEDEDGNAAVIHPVGKTVLTLNKASLGFAQDDDISNHVFLIGHTNKNGEQENVLGEVVVIGEEQFVRVELNGLSRIFIGNIPPLTVSFNTNGGTELPAVKVKLGEITPEVTPPTKEGHFFIGWNVDLNTMLVHRDITVEALWLEGSYVPEERVTLVNWYDDYTFSATSELKVELLESEENEIGLALIVEIEAPELAAKYASSNVAEAAAVAKFEDANEVDGVVSFTQEIIDANGQIITGVYPYYIKWFDAEGNALTLETVSLVVESDSRSAIREKTFNINRGVGKVEAYLTASDEEDVDYVAYVNGYLSGNAVQDNYKLYLNSSFDEYVDVESNYGRVDYSKYDGFKLVLAPFEGESYEDKNISVEAYYNNNSGRQNVKVTTALDEAGHYIITNAPDVNIHEIEMESRSLYLYFQIKVGTQSQNVNLNIHGFYDREVVEREYLYTSDWSEVLAALAEHDAISISYSGDAVLEEKLTLTPQQSINITGSFTIADGAELTIEGVSGAAAYVWVSGDITVEAGGKVTTTSQSKTARSYSYTGLNANGMFTLAGNIETPDYGFLMLQSEDFVIEEDGAINNYGNLFVIANDTIVIDGSMTNLAQTVNNYNNEIRLEGNVELNHKLVAKGGYVYIFGETTVAEGAELIIEKGYINSNGKLYNNGTVTVQDGRLTLSNIGYAVNNYGKIDLAANGTLYLPGTKLVHTGEITGKGTIILEESVNISANYDNGIDYVRVEGTKTLNNYDRYMFVKDPELTATGTVYVSEISGDGSVANAVKVVTATIPE